MRLILTLLLLVVLPVWADQLIIEPEMGRKPILDAINDAQYSVDLVMYGFTDTTLLDAIIQKKINGKRVQVILEETPYKAEKENNKTITAFAANDVPWLGHIPPFRLIHQKTLLIDDKQAIIMTFNFTKSTFKNQRNFALIIDDAQRVNKIKSIFSADWNHVPYFNNSLDVILSPDDSRKRLISLIRLAKQSIRIYAQNISDYKIVGELEKAAKKGIRIQILTSSRLRDKQNQYLENAGIHIYVHKKLIIHAKVIMIDDKLAVIGSNNLTRSSFDDNRELSVITQDADVIKQLNITFNHDMNIDSTKLIPNVRTIHRLVHQLKDYVNKNL